MKYLVIDIPVAIHFTRTTEFKPDRKEDSVAHRRIKVLGGDSGQKLVSQFLLGGHQAAG